MDIHTLYERLEQARQVRASATKKDIALLTGIEKFCLFVGQSRSGHSVVGTLLNAHRHAVVAHNLDILDFVRAGVSREDLLLLILERDHWLGKRDRFIGGYSYDIPGLWLGYQDEIHLIGDKRAGSSSRYLAEDPNLLVRLQKELGLPLYLIHHVRNPWDNISSIWSAKTLNINRTLQEAIDHYFEMLEGAVTGIASAPLGTSWVRTFHEELIESPKSVLGSLLNWLGLSADSSFLETCATFVHPNPRRTRFNAPWTPQLIRQVDERRQGFDFLMDYRFDEKKK